ncbi:unnamed protein product [Closterium sp. NIES-65]|nr:unnamed protein product [Closterium sp. NIES-65]
MCVRHRQLSLLWPPACSTVQFSSPFQHRLPSTQPPRSFPHLACSSPLPHLLVPAPRLLIPAHSPPRPRTSPAHLRSHLLISALTCSSPLSPAHLRSHLFISALTCSSLIASPLSHMGWEVRKGKKQPTQENRPGKGEATSKGQQGEGGGYAQGEGGGYAQGEGGGYAQGDGGGYAQGEGGGYAQGEGGGYAQGEGGGYAQGEGGGYATGEGGEYETREGGGYEGEEGGEDEREEGGEDEGEEGGEDEREEGGEDEGEEGGEDDGEEGGEDEGEEGGEDGTGEQGAYAAGEGGVYATYEGGGYETGEGGGYATGEGGGYATGEGGGYATGEGGGYATVQGGGDEGEEGGENGTGEGGGYVARGGEDGGEFAAQGQGGYVAEGEGRAMAEGGEDGYAGNLAEGDGALNAAVRQGAHDAGEDDDEDDIERIMYPGTQAGVEGEQGGAEEEGGEAEDMMRQGGEKAEEGEAVRGAEGEEGEAEDMMKQRGEKGEEGEAERGAEGGARGVEGAAEIVERVNLPAGLAAEEGAKEWDEEEEGVPQNRQNPGAASASRPASSSPANNNGSPAASQRAPVLNASGARSGAAASHRSASVGRQPHTSGMAGGGAHVPLGVSSGRSYGSRGGMPLPPSAPGHAAAYSGHSNHGSCAIPNALGGRVSGGARAAASAPASPASVGRVPVANGPSGSHPLTQSNPAGIQRPMAAPRPGLGLPLNPPPRAVKSVAEQAAMNKYATKGELDALRTEFLQALQAHTCSQCGASGSLGAAADGGENNGDAAGVQSIPKPRTRSVAAIALDAVLAEQKDWRGACNQVVTCLFWTDDAVDIQFYPNTDEALSEFGKLLSPDAMTHLKLLWNLTDDFIVGTFNKMCNNNRSNVAKKLPGVVWTALGSIKKQHKVAALPKGVKGPEAFYEHKELVKHYMDEEMGGLRFHVDEDTNLPFSSEAFAAGIRHAFTRLNVTLGTFKTRQLAYAVLVLECPLLEEEGKMTNNPEVNREKYESTVVKCRKWVELAVTNQGVRFDSRKNAFLFGHGVCIDASDYPASLKKNVAT